jgi:alpha-L-fucosidase
MGAEVVAQGGNLLLNVGPSGDGTIPFVQAQRLLAIGWWLRVNGEAIYGTRPWSTVEGTTGDGLDVRFTASSGALYAIVLGTPSTSRVALSGVHPSDGATIELLGRPEQLRWTPTATGVEIDLPGRPPTGPALTLRVSPAPLPVPSSH